MMSASYRAQLADEASAKARRDGTEPWAPESADEVAGAFDAGSPVIPFLGDHKPDGWAQTPEPPMMVDTSGFGSDSEPALTRGQLETRIIRELEEHPGSGWALVEIGQFQGYLQRYERTGGDDVS